MYVESSLITKNISSGAIRKDIEFYDIDLVSKTVSKLEEIEIDTEKNHNEAYDYTKA